MVKYLSFHNSSFGLNILFKCKWQGQWEPTPGSPKYARWMDGVCVCVCVCVDRKHIFHCVMGPMFNHNG